MIPALLLVPTIAGLLAFALPWDRPRRVLLVLTALCHAALTAACVAGIGERSFANGWFSVDASGAFFLSVLSALFLAAAFYAVGFLSREGHVPGRDAEEGLLFSNGPEAVFTGCLLIFLASMTLVTVSHHFGLLWVGIEATTLASAPLVYYHRHHRSLEATWKYLLICSVGIALALLGNFFLAVASGPSSGGHVSLVLGDLLKKASFLNPAWLKAGFLCLLVGYGTKMGLAPMHTWLPDAHSESPSVVSALLSGALLNCAFLGILRVLQVCVAAQLGPFARDLLVDFGLLSMAFAAVFLLGQTDYKRLLAYSSVEHMGILALGVGVGGAAAFGAVFHVVNHSMTKALMFLSAGNILGLYKTKTIQEVRGISRIAPVTGVLWMAGFLSLSGSPPFGTFFSEFSILKGSLEQGRPYVAILFMVFLVISFVAMLTPVLNMTQGEGPRSLSAKREPLLSVLPPIALGLVVLVLGVVLPPWLEQAFHEIALVWVGP